MCWREKQIRRESNAPKLDQYHQSDDDDERAAKHHASCNRCPLAHSSIRLPTSSIISHHDCIHRCARLNSPSTVCFTTVVVVAVVKNIEIITTTTIIIHSPLWCISNLNRLESSLNLSSTHDSKGGISGGVVASREIEHQRAVDGGSAVHHDEDRRVARRSDHRHTLAPQI